jgi:hypothetical protein
MTPTEREWLSDYIAMMKSNLAIHPGITALGQEMNISVIDRIVEVQIALNVDCPYVPVTKSAVTCPKCGANFLLPREEAT